MVGTAVGSMHTVTSVHVFKKAASLRDRWADVAASDGEDEVESPRSATSSALLFVDEAARPCAWNLDAPDFIPTLTMACPVVSMCSFVPQDFSPAAAEAAWAAEAARGGDDAFPSAVLAPRLGRAQTDPSACSASSRRSSGPAARLGVRHAAARPVAARPGAYCKTRRPVPMRLLSSPALPSVHARSNASKARVEQCEEDVEVLSEELWENRTLQRQKDISLAKATVEGQWCGESKQEVVEQHHAGVREATPDPMDRSISKRQWKYRVGCWRNNLFQRYQEHVHLSEVRSVSQASVVSVEDCHSSHGDCETTTSAGSTRASRRELEDHEDDTPCAQRPASDEDTPGVC